MPDTFTLRLFADAGGHPGELIQTLDLAPSTKERTGANTGNAPEFEYAADLRTPFLARAGVRYWLSICNPALVWAWEPSQDHSLIGSARSLSDPINGPWQSNDLDFAFQLESVAGGLSNLSTRAWVGTGEDALIVGFIITGSEPTRVLLRALGPSLSAYGVTTSLNDTTLGLYDTSGALLAANNDWKLTELGDLIHTNQIAELQAIGAAPTNDRESALIVTLQPNRNYTALIRGLASSSGIAVAEIYDLNYGSVARLANISTRSLVRTGEQVMIAGFIVRKPSGRVIVRALGPSLQAFGINNALPDPFLELHDSNGAVLASNDSWRSDQEAEIIGTTVPPSQNLEAAIVTNLPAGAYTGIIRDANGAVGVGLIEVYDLDP